MTDKLAGLVSPVLEPCGYRQGWGTATVARIRHEIPEDVGSLTLCRQRIDEVLTRGELWQGREVATEIPAYVYLLHRELEVRVTKEYLEAAAIGEAPKSIDFVRAFLGTEANFDPLTATCLFLQSEFERVELEGELAMAIAHLLEAWPQITSTSKGSFSDIYLSQFLVVVACS